MDYLIMGFVLFVLFFALRTNYKISNLEEGHKKSAQRLSQEVEKIFSKIKMDVESIEKKIVFLQKTLNEMKESNDQSAAKNLNIVKKQLAAVKSDTDLIKSIYLKPEHKSVKTQTSKTLETQNKVLPSEERNTKEFKKETTEKNYNKAFGKKLREKIQNLNGDEIWILKQLLAQEPLAWQNISDLEDDVAMPKFKIPKLSRQFIIDGLPILMIKHAGEKMYVKWGDGLTKDKIEDIQKEMRGDW